MNSGSTYSGTGYGGNFNDYTFRNNDIAAIGDVNGDGYDDVAFSWSTLSGAGNGTYSIEPQNGIVYVLFGGPEGVDTDAWYVDTPDGLPLGLGLLPGQGADVAIFNATPYDYVSGVSDSGFGAALAAAGDVNGDGYDDFMIGLPNDWTTGSYGNPGRAFVIYGGIDALESADNADGTNDNVIDLNNLSVDVETGIRPIDVSLRSASGFSIYCNEGQGGATVYSFTVVRTGDLTQTVSFDYAVTSDMFANGADASDFVGGVLPIGAVGGLTGDLFTNAQISNDDFPVILRVNDTSVTEGNGDLTFVITRSGDTTSAATVSWVLQPGTAGWWWSGLPADASDLTAGLPQGGTVDFASGQTQASVSISVIDDGAIEQHERVELRLTNGTSPNADATFDLQTYAATGTIFNDDFPVFLRASGTYVTEDAGGSIVFTITRRGNFDAEVTVDYQFSPAFTGVDGADFVSGFPPNGSVVFLPGEVTKTFTLPVQADVTVEPNPEYIQMLLVNATAAPGVVIDRQTWPVYGGIYNDDFNVELSVLGASGAENGGPITVTVQRGGRRDVAVDVTYQLDPGSASGQAATQSDVMNLLPMTGLLSFGIDQDRQTFTITPQGDTTIELDEFLEVRLTGATATSTLPAGVNIVLQDDPSHVRIVNDDFPVEIRATGSSRLEGDGVLTATITRSGRTDVEVTVDYALTSYAVPGFGVDAGDLVQTLPVTTSVTFAADELVKTITLNPVADSLIENSEYIELNLSNARLSGASVGSDGVINLQTFPAYLEIRNDDFPITLNVYSASVTEGGDLAFTIYRSGFTGAAVSVDWALTAYP